MENLNKENFFNEMESRYPAAMQHFHDFIDEYKASVNWDKLFSVKYQVIEPEREDVHYKFHDLPFEMQFGIISKFMVQVWNDPHVLLQLDIDQIKARLRQAFIGLERKLPTKMQEAELDKLKR